MYILFIISQWSARVSNVTCFAEKLCPIWFSLFLLNVTWFIILTLFEWKVLYIIPWNINACLPFSIVIVHHEVSWLFSDQRTSEKFDSQIGRFIWFVSRIQREQWTLMQHGFVYTFCCDSANTDLKMVFIHACSMFIISIAMQDYWRNINTRICIIGRRISWIAAIMVVILFCVERHLVL